MITTVMATRLPIVLARKPGEAEESHGACRRQTIK